MNVKDAQEPDVVADRLVSIFDKQHALMEKYGPIEAKNGCLQTADCPVNINSTQGQARIKDFFWRLTEELGEALDAAHHGDMMHAQEELADGLHFLTEATWLAGGRDYLVKALHGVQSGMGSGKDLLDALYKVALLGCKGQLREQVVERFILEAGMTCNCLKNKPWKQTQMLTDVARFHNNLFSTWIWYIAICSYFVTPDELYSFYFKKNQVNQFRQRSNY